jgi:hypothetical protein
MELYVRLYLGRIGININVIECKTIKKLRVCIYVCISN